MQGDRFSNHELPEPVIHVLILLLIFRVLVQEIGNHFEVYKKSEGACKCNYPRRVNNYVYGITVVHLVNPDWVEIKKLSRYLMELN